MLIDKDELMRAAERETGLSDWGSGKFHEALTVFIDAINKESNLPEGARTGVAGWTKVLMSKRLRLYRDRKQFPEIPAQRITKPLIVIGLPRSGTTFLHALLAQDPRCRSPLQWEIDDPSPPPRRETHKSDPRIAPSQARVDAMAQEFKAMHMIGAEIPVECNSIKTVSFQSVNMSAPYVIPTYVDWHLQANPENPYETHLHVLQHLQAFCPGEWWTLKSPAHMYTMPQLLKTYPDARIVFPHRDPAATLPSMASLIAFLRRAPYNGAVPNAVSGHEMARTWEQAIKRTMAFREDPASDKHVFDVRYDDVVTDPIGAVRAIYANFGIPFSAEAEAAMRKFLAEQPKDKHGAHKYTLADFGLDKAKIHRDFAAYIEAYLK